MSFSTRRMRMACRSLLCTALTAPNVETAISLSIEGETARVKPSVCRGQCPKWGRACSCSDAPRSARPGLIIVSFQADRTDTLYGDKPVLADCSHWWRGAPSQDTPELAKMICDD